MREGKASYTAEGVAFYRALESSRPADERGCDDPLAGKLLGPRFRLLYRWGLSRRSALWYLERGSLSPSYWFLISRTAYIDDCLSAKIAEGIDQMVILGAGLDSRAYRFDGLHDGVKVFEVDHPDTQTVKIRRLKKALGSLPSNVTYVPVNFEREKLESKLLECGYDPRAKTHFIWEGVVTYLTEDAVDETLAFVAGSSGEGSSIVLTYMLKESVGTISKGAKWWHLAYLRKKGEPLIFFLEKDALEGFLSTRGFELVDNLSGEGLTDVYLKSTSRWKRANRYSVVALAAVQAGR